MLIKYYMAKNCCKMNLIPVDNIRGRAEDQQAAYKWTKFELIF